MINRMNAIRKRGFNLIEAAIVLGVVGAVIGGIWTAASAVIENWKVSKTVEDLSTVSINVQNRISFRDAATLIENNGGSSVHITWNLLNESSDIPEDWRRTNYDILRIWHRFDGEARVWLYPTSFLIVLSQIPRSACVDILPRVSNYYTNSSLKEIKVNSVHRNRNTFPVTLQDSDTLCASGKNDLYFYYGYTRINN